MGRILASAHVKSHLNPVLRRSISPEVPPPVERGYILWFDIYEVFY